MEEISLPTWDEVNEKFTRCEELNPIENFIYNNEPAGRRDAEAFRLALRNAMEYLNNDTIRELNLYKQALTKAVSLPKGVLPHENDKYFTCMLNGNCVVKEDD